MIRVMIGFVLSLLLAAALMPFVIRLADRLKAKQPILHYVKSHSVKSGTPTMGGMGIIAAAALPFAVLLRGESSAAIVCLIVTAGYGIVGFTDDFIKVHFRHNEGLSARWKLALQFVIACLISAYAFFGTSAGGRIYIPFVNTAVDLSYFALAYYVFVFLAFTNSVNLTDGLDGLAGSVTAVFLTVFALLMLIVCAFEPTDGQVNELLLMSCFCGALCGFLCFNRYPARIFMGDTGSLALGGLLASLSVLTGLSLSAAIIGIIYVASSVSVIVQVAWFKLTGKRVFLMAPLHHHFEQKGVHENHIVAGYTAATAVAGASVILLSVIFIV